MKNYPEMQTEDNYRPRWHQMNSNSFLNRIQTKDAHFFLDSTLSGGFLFFFLFFLTGVVEGVVSAECSSGLVDKAPPERRDARIKFSQAVARRDNSVPRHSKPCAASHSLFFFNCSLFFVSFHLRSTLGRNSIDRPSDWVVHVTWNLEQWKRRGKNPKFSLSLRGEWKWGTYRRVLDRRQPVKVSRNTTARKISEKLLISTAPLGIGCHPEMKKNRPTVLAVRRAKSDPSRFGLKAELPPLSCQLFTIASEGIGSEWKEAVHRKWRSKVWPGISPNNRN